MKISQNMIYIDNAGIISLDVTESVNLIRDGRRVSNSIAGMEAHEDKATIHFKDGCISIEAEKIPSEGIYDGCKASCAAERIEIYRVECRYMPAREDKITEFSVTLDFSRDRKELWKKAENSFHWIPNIKSKPWHVAGNHAFRSPAAVLTAEGYGAALIPDIMSIVREPDYGRYLDLGFHDSRKGAQAGIPSAPWLEYGICSNTPDGHVYYKKDGRQYTVDKKGLTLSFYVLSFAGLSDTEITGIIASFHWKAFASRYDSMLLPQTVPFSKYAEYGNNMAMELLWQQGPREDTGGIVLSTFRRADGVSRGREYADDIWFHAWFNNMRTAMELAEFGRSEGNALWIDRAFAIARCLVSSPQKDGIFATIYAPHDGGWIGSSQHGGGRDLYSVPDCAWAGLWLRKFIMEYGSVEGADNFLASFRSFLYRHQNPGGGFPNWVRTDTLEHDPRLQDSSSGAMALWFLGEELLSGAVPLQEREAALRTVVSAAEQIMDNALRLQKFEDYELYYSCSEKPLDFYDSMSRLYGQNTLAIQWCAEGLRCAYLLTGVKKYMDAGLFCLNLLSFYQQVWDTPHLDFYTFGGFGVMNTDGEWNDARQAQFAETYMNYYDLTGRPEYLKRAVAAARASFALMAIAENREVCPRNYHGSETQREPHGGSAENYGHSGFNRRSGCSGFHWGTGSALVTAARIKKRYGDLYIDATSQTAVGIDGIAVKEAEFSGRKIRLEADILDAIGSFRVLYRNKKAPAKDLPDITIPGFRVSLNNNGSYTAKRI